MDATAYTLDHYRSLAQARDRRMLAALVTISAVLAALVLLAPPGWYAVLLAASIAFVVVTWYRPACGIAALLGCALLFEQFDFASFEPITRTVPFFASLSSSTGVGLLVMSPFEIGLLAVCAITGTRGVVTRTAWNDRATRFVAPFLVVLAFWLGYGLLGGGSPSIALWELRSFAYLAAFVFLTSYAVKDELDVKLLLGTGAVVVVGKALQALWSYAVVLRFDLGKESSLTAHEDALFMAWIVALLGVSLAYRVMPKLQALLLVSLPALGSAFIATDRRAAYVALAVGMCVLATLLLTDRTKRPLVVRVALPLALVVLLVLAVGWNGDGALSRPARAVKSIMQPETTQDAQSNYYRRAEEAALIVAIRRSPIVGLGFGTPFEAPGRLAKIDYAFAEYIAHNQIMWLWAKLGTLGFAAFWMTAGGLICYGAVVFRAARLPLTRVVAATATCALVMQLVVSYVDMQLTFARNMTFLGVLIGLLASVARLEEADDHATA